MSCRCGCVTSDELRELERRVMNLLAALGAEEAMCPEQAKRWDASGGTYASNCRYDCEACGGLSKVPKVDLHEHSEAHPGSPEVTP